MDKKNIQIALVALENNQPIQFVPLGSAEQLLVESAKTSQVILKGLLSLFHQLDSLNESGKPTNK